MRVIPYANTYGQSLVADKTPEETLLQELGEPYRLYREQWHAANAFAYRPPFPIHLDVETVYACNLRCVMCPHGDPTHVHPPYKGRSLDTEVLKAVIKGGVPQGLRAMRFSGLNEPLLYKDLLDVIAYARQQGILDVFITTNGMLLTEEISTGLIQAGLTHLMVSIDAATPDTYAAIRTGGDFDTVARNVERFLSIRSKMQSVTPQVRLSFIKMQGNIHELDAFVERWKATVDHLAIVGYLQIVSDQERHQGLTLDKGEAPQITNFQCSQPWTRCAIFANGDVFPCCMNWGRKQPVGNIHNEDLGVIWRSDAVRHIQDISKAGEFRRHPICAQCVPKRDTFAPEPDLAGK